MGWLPNQHHFAVLIVAVEGEDDRYGHAERSSASGAARTTFTPLHMGRADAGGCVCLTRA